MGVPFLENLGFEVIKTQAQQYAKGLVAELKTHITKEVNRAMASIDDALTAHGDAITKELAQLQDALAQVAQAAGDKAAVEAALSDAQAKLSEVQSRVEGFTAALASDDPAPEPEPTEPPA